MNKSRKSFTVAEAKIQAAILLKSLSSKEPVTADKALLRLQKLPEFSKLSTIKLKHALAVIALENGFNSWADLKCQIPFICGGFLNQWFADYASAKDYLQTNGGFLLPYKKQFFICEANYIKNLGFDPTDPDWQRIGHDWAFPADQKAWQRLYKLWMQITGGSDE